MFIPKMKKMIALWFVDMVATMKKYLGHPLDFYQKFMNFKGVTKSYYITFGTAEPNSISAKRSADAKMNLQIMFIPRKKEHLIFSKLLSW